MITIIFNAPMAIKYTKACINKGLEVSLEYGLVYEKDFVSLCTASDDCKEGINIFVSALIAAVIVATGRLDI